jgi:hypothetical protein
LLLAEGFYIAVQDFVVTKKNGRKISSRGCRQENNRLRQYNRIDHVNDAIARHNIRRRHTRLSIITLPSMLLI